MPLLRLIFVAVAIAAGAVLAEQLPQAPEIAQSVEPEYSPLGYYDLRAFEQAYPADPQSLVARTAVSNKYWVFRSVARRGGQGPAEVWTSLGPETSIQGNNVTDAANVSGRVAALAISPACQLNGRCRLWVGSAGGGVWRTDDALHPTDPKWRWVSYGLGTNNIGSLAVDPNDPSGDTIYVGTGETNQPNNSGAGTGVYRSTNGGDRWTRLSTMILDPAVSAAPIDFTFSRGISTVVIEPGRPQAIYVATTSAMFGMTAVRGGQSQITGMPQPRVGLYKTENGGQTWSLIWVPPLDPVIPPNPHLGVGVGDTMFGVRDVKLDPRDPRIVYASAWNNAIHRSAPPLENGDPSFKPVFAIVGPGRFRDLAMFDLAVKDGHTRMYVYNGTDNVNPQGLYRLDNADVPAATLVSGSGASLSNTGAWVLLTSNDPGHPGSTSRRICGTQCFYDLAVASPEERPDTVYIAGVVHPTWGDPTMRSSDGGVSFTSFGSDAANPRNDSHVDVRAIVFHPRNPDIVFVGSDGGVVRSDGRFEDIGNRCGQLFGTGAAVALCRGVLSQVPTRLYYMNRGLQTLQFYNIAVDPRDPLRRLIGGLQDNSTIWQDGTGDPRVWKSLFPFGDGTSASGFHPTRPEVLFASFQSDRFFTNFRNGEPGRWVRTDDPIRGSNERDTITQSTGRQFISFDTVWPDTQFTGFQHVWRTQNNGGPQGFLESNCGFPGGTSSQICGDWVPLGVAFPFAPGSTPASPSRQPGDLTSTFYGGDRSGGIIVSVERSAADAGTLWAATSFGRLFVSKNADAPGPDVQFVRVDSPAVPNRFVTRIFVDRFDPNVAYISYSGFSAVTPSTPGHIFRARYDPDARRATFTSVDFDLGDIPINTIAFDDIRGDLYAATDFGPLVLRSGSSEWEVAGVGFPEALMVDLEIVPDRRLLIAATHGIGIFYLRLPQ
jgi:hypothetical protein